MYDLQIFKKSAIPWLPELIYFLMAMIISLKVGAQELAVLPGVESDDPHKNLFQQDRKDLKSLQEVLEQLEKEYHVSIVGESHLLQGKFVKTDQLKRGTAMSLDDLKDILQKILPPLGLEFDHYENSFVIQTAAKRRDPLKKIKRKGLDNADNARIFDHGNSAMTFSSDQFQRFQERVITGRVTDQEGQPIPGVNILEQGTVRGTITDAEGNYSINVTDVAKILVFSYVGYISEEVIIDNRAVVNVTLFPDVSQLSEVVVIGYGTKKKRDVIGSVASVSSQEINQLPFPSFDASLQGLAAGVQAISTSGVPGAPVRVLIRGTNSISSGTDPLYIVDGMPIFAGLNGLERTNATTPQSPLSLINPNDIASIEILKDAAATAIYGSRGSNGVILITTKSGKNNEGTTEISYNAGISEINRTAGDVGFANTREWFGLMDQARANSGLTPYDPSLNTNFFIDDPVSTLTRGQAENIQTDWFDQIIRTGSFQDINISSSRGTERGAFYISANYRDDQGILKTNRLQRFSGRANLDFTPVNNLQTGVRLNLVYTKNDRVKSAGGGGLSSSSGGNSGGFAQANRNALSWYPINNPDHESGYWNPLAGINLAANIDENLIQDNVEQYRALGNIFLDYSLPWVKGLSFRTELSVDFIQNNSVFWVDGFLREDGAQAVDRAVTSNNFNYNLYATYNRAFGQHHINAVFGGESQESDRYRRESSGDQLSGTYQQLGSPGNRLSMFAGLEGERYLRAFFGRVDYKFKDRYIFGISLRRDGSSAFTPDNRWGTFTAFSAGWILSDEEFFNLNAFNLFKIRGSFGQTGNQNIPGGLDVTQYRSNRRYGTEDVISGGTTVRSIGSADLTWETTNSYDIGIDFGLLQNRISGSVAYYIQDVEDLLLQVPIPVSTGLDGSSSIWANAGKLNNQGLEFNISAVNVNKGNFKWTTTFNLTLNTNEIKELNPDVDASGQGIISGNTITRKGGRLGAYFLAEYAGIDPQRGVELIYEIDRDLFLETGETVKTGRRIPATQTNVRDHRIIHNDQTGLPTYFGGFTNTFDFKGFDLSVFFSFMGGNHIYDYAQHRTSYAQRGQQVLRKEIIGNTWTQPGDNAQYPQLRWDSSYPWNWNNETREWVEESGNYNHESIFHDRFLQKVDFIRLRNVQLGYNFPQQLLKKLKLQGLRMFVSGTNLLTFTDYDGWDPEVTITTGGNQNVNLSPGFIGNPPLPHLRTYSFGLNAKF